MELTILTKNQALDYLESAITKGHYTMDERGLAELRAVRDFVKSLDILDGD